MINLQGSFPWGRVVSLLVVVFPDREERVSLFEAGDHLQEFLFFFLGLNTCFPRLPVFHDPQQFELVMRLHNKLFNQACRYFFFNLTDRLVLVNYFHAEPGKLTAQNTIGVLLG